MTAAVAAGITLTCLGCGRTGRFPAHARVDGVPILAWFTERKELCVDCYVDSLHRASDPATSRAGAKDVAVRSGSQRHKLLAAYADGAELTADEAMRRAGVSDRSCYWKRVSELVDGGLLEDTGVTRPGEQGSAQRVNRITPHGRAAL